jgi:hypothetical protein
LEHLQLTAEVVVLAVQAQVHLNFMDLKQAVVVVVDTVITASRNLLILPQVQPQDRLEVLYLH